MQRSTRLRRFAVALLVVFVLAVAARFARAGSADAGATTASELRGQDRNLFLPTGAR
jgi:hypothetical protein